MITLIWLDLTLTITCNANDRSHNRREPYARVPPQRMLQLMTNTWCRTWAVFHIRLLLNLLDTCWCNMGCVPDRANFMYWMISTWTWCPRPDYIILLILLCFKTVLINDVLTRFCPENAVLMSVFDVSFVTILSIYFGRLWCILRV